MQKDENTEINEFVVCIPVKAWRAARELDANCMRCGLDTYMQAQVLLQAAETEEEERLWADVWSYIEPRELAGWNDRFLVVLDLEEERRHRHPQPYEVDDEIPF